MSRCKACDVVLTEDELVRKWPPTQEGKVDYVDLCTDCYCSALGIDTGEYVSEFGYFAELDKHTDY